MSSKSSLVADGGYGSPETRDRILQAAWDEIVSNSAGFPLTAVAKRASVSRQAIYLHFSDRPGLLMALIQYANRQIGLREQLDAVTDAADGVAALKKLVQVAANIAPPLDPVIRAFEEAQHTDEVVAAAWQATRKGRRHDHQLVIERLRQEGRLADGWTIDQATDFFFSATMPGLWRELVVELGWTSDAYVDKLTTTLMASLIADPTQA